MTNSLSLLMDYYNWCELLQNYATKRNKSVIYRCTFESQKIHYFGSIIPSKIQFETTGRSKQETARQMVLRITRNRDTLTGSELAKERLIQMTEGRLVRITNNVEILCPDSPEDLIEN